jgi:hypothetical protein
VSVLSYGSPAYTFYFLLLNAFPESLVLVMAIFSLLNLRFKAGPILAIAALQAVTNLIMFLPINLGVHSIILLITMVIYIYIFTRARLSKIFLMVLICWVILVLAEMLYSGPLLQFTGLTVDAVRNNAFLISAFEVPYELVFLIFALLKNCYNRRRGWLADA